MRVWQSLRKNSAWAVFGFSLLAVNTLCAADFTVTTPNGQFAFQINGVNSPTLTLTRGRTYSFAVSTSSFHPFRINVPGAPAPTISGTLNLTVPTNAVNYTYDCQIHGVSMQGTILTIDPPSPPVPRIVSYSFGDDIVLRSAPATNTFSIIPEFKTNLNNTNWVALTVLSNRFASGTNETFCGRPPGTNLFIRVRVQ